MYGAYLWGDERNFGVRAIMLTFSGRLKFAIWPYHDTPMPCFAAWIRNHD